MTSAPFATPAPTVFALLDDALAPPGQARSRLYTGWVREHRCTQAAALDATWQAVAADQRAGLHALLLADYEWGEALVSLPTPAPRAALRVLMFAQLRQLEAAEVAAWLAEQEGCAQPAPAGLVGAQASVSQPQFEGAIAQILQAIRSGETYQVNYSYRWQAQLVGQPLALYRRLRARQPVAYGALIALPVQAGGAQPWVLSLSPELFVRAQPQGQGMQLLAQPMKGTAPRTPGLPAQAQAQADAAARHTLAQDAKNRAENLMIVDLLRNDLGRIAQTGSVCVPALFEVQTLPTVFQMTSSVQAQALPAVDVPALLRATFPCGSITGAPKRHTMGLIRQLESTPRGLYCGAIGWVDAPAPGQALGALCLSVAIRTLEIQLPAGSWQAGCALVRWGVGGGVVLDSDAASEWAETHWKARFITQTDPGFALFETLYLSAAGELRAWPWHLARLHRSAAALGWPLDEAAAQALLHTLAQELSAGAGAAPAPLGWRLRLSLAFDGALQLMHAPLPPLPLAADGCVTLGRAAQVLPGAHVLSAHKTTLRAVYDAAIGQAEQQGDFDLLFFNQAGELVEGGRSNVFVQLAGRWYTPPLSSGALPGVMRAQVLADPAWQASERRLYAEDLAQAQALMVCNALRGCLAARLVERA